MTIAILNNNNTENINDAESMVHWSLEEGKVNRRGASHGGIMMFHQSRCSRGGTFLDVVLDKVVLEAITEGDQERQKEKGNSNHVYVVENPTWTTSRVHFQGVEICKNRSSLSRLLHER